MVMVHLRPETCTPIPFPLALRAFQARPLNSLKRFPPNFRVTPPLMGCLGWPLATLTLSSLINNRPSSTTRRAVSLRLSSPLSSSTKPQVRTTLGISTTPSTLARSAIPLSTAPRDSGLSMWTAIPLVPAHPYLLASPLSPTPVPPCFLSMTQL